MHLSPYKRLIKHGFRSEKGEAAFKKSGKSDVDRWLYTISDEDAKDYADVEIAEEAFLRYDATEYPKPIKRFWLAFETPDVSLDNIYNWFMHQLGVEFSLKLEKIVDNYAASEASSFFGMMQQRLSIQQGNISNYLKGISEMVKGLFQIVREIRIMNDRLQYYQDTYEQNENKLSSEIVLKGLWVDQVEGGAKNPASVYGLASQVGFTILPDAFFRMSLKGPKEVDKAVDALQFNEKVKEILKRKLRQYYEWKERSFSEIETRRKFMLKYLKQHYETINMYTSWIKPYLRYVNRMQQMEKLENSPNLVKSFDGAFIEIELIGTNKTAGNKSYNNVLILNIQHRSKPQTPTNYQQDTQKQAYHTGRTNLKFRAYAWTDEQVKNYKAYKKEEDIALLASIDESIKEALDSLGTELKNYLGLEGEVFGEEKRIHTLAENLVFNNISKDMKHALEKAKEMVTNADKKPRQPTALEPFVSVFKGFADIFSAFGITNIKLPKKSNKPDSVKDEKEYQKAVTFAKLFCYLSYKNYKKSNGMPTW